MQRKREVGIKGIRRRISWHETDQQTALRRTTEHHRVTEANARWAAKNVGKYLELQGLQSLAEDEDYVQSLAKPYGVTKDHVPLFVRLVRDYVDNIPPERRVESPAAAVIRVARAIGGKSSSS